MAQSNEYAGVMNDDYVRRLEAELERAEKRIAKLQGVLVDENICPNCFKKCTPIDVIVRVDGCAYCDDEES